MIEIYKMMAGVQAANCYLVNKGQEGFIIDPGGEADKIARVIRERGFEPKFILLTHGHGDHIGGALELKEIFSIPILAHQDEAALLKDPEKNLSLIMPSMADTSIVADQSFKGGDVLFPDSFNIKVIHTPGHTMGCCLYEVDGNLFTGDTLFKTSIGRTDLICANPDDMIDSLDIIKSLDEDLIVWPGHGPDSTIGFEKKNNPYLNGSLIPGQM